MKLLLLCLFAALLATANSLTCDCTPGPPICKENKTCTIGKGRCVSIAGVTKIEGTTETPAVFKGCQDSREAFDMCKEGILYITTKEGYYLNSETKCCDADQCNNATLEVPKENTNLSQRVCPSCFAVNSASCNTTVMNCSESQHKCLSMIGTYTKGDKTRTFVVKGCATSTAAILKSGSQVFLGDVSYNITKSSIEDAKGSASQGPGNVIYFTILLPGLLGLLLDKFLY